MVWRRHYIRNYTAFWDAVRRNRYHPICHDRHVRLHWKRDKQANKQTIHWANNLKKQLFFISVKDRAFLHGKVVLTQFNANQWFYGPVYAKWLALT